MAQKKSSGNKRKQAGRGPSTPQAKKNTPRKRSSEKQSQEKQKPAEEMRLNKFIAHAGICSRRDADTLIDAGKVKVNGKVVTEMGYKVLTSDRVEVDGQKLVEESFVYILMHKPKDTITTTNDEKDRKTVMDVIEENVGARVYPVGRLDRNTTGVLLLTNDGDLANRLMHPSYQINKTYKVTTERPLADEELEMLKKGVELDDGPAKAYNIKRLDSDPLAITLSLHEGRNRQIRRMMIALGTEVRQLARISYAGLTTRALRPGRWRFLKPKEVNILRSKVKLMEFKHNV